MRMKDVQKEILENKKRHNFNTTDIEQEFCYLYGEVREAYEAYVEMWDTFGEELADVTNFLMGIAEILGINLEKEILNKMYGMEQKDGIAMLPKAVLTNAIVLMKELQGKIRQNDAMQGTNIASMEQLFCELYGKIGDAYEAYYKGKGNFTDLLVEIACCLMRMAEIGQIDLGSEIVQKVEKNKSRIYKRNGLGYMVHL